MAATLAAEVADASPALASSNELLPQPADCSAVSPELQQEAAVVGASQATTQQQQNFLSIVSKVSRWIAASDRHVRCLFAEDRSTSTTATQLSPSVLSEAGELERTALAERLRQDAVDRAAAARLARCAAGTQQQANNNHGRHSNQRRSNGCYGSSKKIFENGCQDRDRLGPRSSKNCDSIGCHGNINRSGASNRPATDHRSCRLSLKLHFERPAAEAGPDFNAKPVNSRGRFPLTNFHA